MNFLTGSLLRKWELHIHTTINLIFMAIFIVYYNIIAVIQSDVVYVTHFETSIKTLKQS